MFKVSHPQLNFLLLNQTFYPDAASTAQHLTDLALELVQRGHRVTVVTGRRAYVQPERLFPKQEAWRGIQILRVGSTGLGKSAKWRRVADFASFWAACSLRVLCLPRPDVVLALTSPPLISVLGAWTARLRRSRFVYWVMDFNPDEAIAAGWLRPDSVLARTLERMSRFSLKRADRVIALDHFMRERIIAKGIAPEKIATIPPWSHDRAVQFDLEARARFRKAHGLDGKFVVMYSGNHSPCHPLDTLLEAAKRLAGDPQIVFCCVGGGSEFNRVRQWAQLEELRNVICLPYQPLSDLSASLSSADLHVVVMGNLFVGLVHPCKIYNILQVAAPVLYVGPRPSHVSEIVETVNGELACASVRHGDVEAVIHQIRRVRELSPNLTRQAPEICSAFSEKVLLPKLVANLEGTG